MGDKIMNRDNLKKRLRESLLDEDALRSSYLPKGTGLFIKPTNAGATLVLYNPHKDDVYGTITFGHYPSVSSFYDVSGVAAERGFGPFMYELAMMYVNERGNMLTPSRDGDVRGEAWYVWQRFYDRDDVIKKSIDLYEDEFRFDILGFEGYFDKEEKEEMWNEYDNSDKVTLIIFNTGYSLSPTTEYKNLINVGKSYSEITKDKAQEKGDEFWQYKYGL